jgi:hypothetical protein
VVPGRLELGRLAGLREPLQIEADDPAAPAWLVAVAHRPRLYLAGRVRSASPEEALAFALDPASAGGGETVVEGPVPAGLGDGEGQAAIEAETAGRVRISARSARSALLVLNDTWAPGWTARVDGAPAPILRANDLVRGVSLPPGEHQVLFEYRTPGLRAGAAVALAWALGLAVLAWRERRRRPALP